MAIIYDPAKRDWTLRERGLDFQDAAEVFSGPNYRRRDDRRDYGEARIITVGFLRNRMVVVVWTPRNGDRHIISMRKANEREKTSYAPHFKANRQ